MTNTDILSIQLYSLRKYGDLSRALDLVARVGFRQVEPVMSHYEKATAMRSALDARDLTAPSGHFSLDAVTHRTDWVVDVAKTVGTTQIIVPAVPTDVRTGRASDWRGTAAAMARASAQLTQAGLTLAYHNHDWDLQPTDEGPSPLDILFETPILKWQADVAWIARADVDVDQWLTKYEDRLISCHVKDMAPEGQNLDEDGWTAVGDGVMDWRALWTRCRKTPATWMVVEHDNPKHFEPFVERSFTFLQNLAA